ncbi:peptide-methionine (S)-S-oxide reductase MsrA [Methyloglobulus sp.]|uniref:peptide-methionine (S)-S-oxide reductase MsrA n=1 Tax=Methyloglobulus sp. TaxID=2518622 RepID=UPI0039891626
MKIKFLKAFFKVLLVNSLLLSGSSSAKQGADKNMAVAMFAGGCFWCMEPPFDALTGVISTISGYTGGHTENPTYKEVSNGKTGHSEAGQVTYDPAMMSYETLLEVFWHNIDPFDEKGEFCDRGDQYKATIFYLDEQQKNLAEASKVVMEKRLLDKVIVTSIKPAGKFYPAEDNHQNYYLKHPILYEFYRFTCGRDRRLNKIWNE